MKTLVFKTDTQRVILEYETVNGYHAFTATEEEFVNYSYEQQLDYCQELASEIGAQWFVDNPDSTFYDLVGLLVEEYPMASDMDDFEVLDDNSIEGWDVVGAGQHQVHVPSEIVGLWDTYHLKDIEDNGDVDKIKEIIKKYEISL